MSFSHFTSNTQTPTAEINMTPLVDVMLVLLIIFMITAPLMVHSLSVDLPRANSQALEKPAVLIVRIAADNQVFIEGTLVHEEALRAQLKEISAQKSTTELHIEADKKSLYETVAHVMSAAREVGIERIGFVSIPSI